ncbi:MAG: type II CRISPR-associated endonuclease Cas1 [Lachnospiraceae bacterium]|nr:type II CRISPR-associated endonuclease Cas1 [Lachnospiraceae bacterium]
MSWRTVVVTGSAKLDYQMGFLVVRKEKITKIHLNEIAILLIDSTAVSITTALINELLKQKVKIVFCNEKRNPCGEIVPYYGSHDTSAKIRAQIAWSYEDKKKIWTEIVREKIRKQSSLLQNLEKKEYLLLEQYVAELQYGDESNREGHAAKVYFNALFGMDFSRTSDSPLNAALNYGYSIILSSFTKEICANGYLTQIGIFHDNMFNPFNLASDMMEPFRVLVDRAVHDMGIKQFGTEEKIMLIDLLNSMVVIAGRSEYVSNAVKIYCKSIFDALNERDTSLIKYYEL